MRRQSVLVEKLTPREWEVLALVREGLTNDQIASRLGISRDGVKYHVSEILGKLGVEDRIEAARWYDRETRQRPGVFAWFGSQFGGRDARPAVHAVAVGGLVFIALGLIALLAGVIVMQARGIAMPEVLVPDRSTGDDRLDEMISRLVSGDAGTLRQSAAGVIAVEFDLTTDETTSYAPEEWSDLLASGSGREVYAVLQGHPAVVPERDFDVHLRVVSIDGEVTGWTFSVANYAVIEIRLGRDPSWLAGVVGSQYDQFIVLPPSDDLPSAPPAHPLAVSTGNPGIDAILAAVGRHDLGALLTLEDFDAVPCGGASTPVCNSLPAATLVDGIGVTNCGGFERRYVDEAFLEQRLAEVDEGVVGVVGIADVPKGYFPDGEQMVIILGQESPFVWQTNALLVTDGLIKGLISRCSNQPALLYPPSGFVVEPPESLDELDPSRRSGMRTIDAVLDALEAKDIDALASLTSYEVIGCSTEWRGLASPPPCEDGEDDGALIAVMPVAQCEGYFSRKRDVEAEVLPQLAGPSWALYAVLDLGDEQPGQDDFRRGRYEVILHDPSQPERQQSIALGFDNDGVTTVWYGCCPMHPSELYWPGNSPDWVLVPP